MDKFNPRDEQDRILSAYEKVLEMTPYDGMHITHTGKIDHIKKIYNGQYKITQSPSTKSWYVLGKNGPEWVPVTSSFPDKESANKFLKWIQGAGELQKKMVGTIDGTDKRVNEEVNESTGNWLHGRFFELLDFLDTASGYISDKAADKLPMLKKETEKLYKTFQKNLKGSGLKGW